MSNFPTNPALEAAIVTYADEDTPRLAYADWLDENGDPDRAAFIRVQCRLAEMPPDDVAWYDSLEQEGDLATRLQDRFPSLRPTLPEHFHFGTHFTGTDEEAQFQRGFPFFINYQSQGWTYQEVERVADNLAQLVATTTIRGFQPYMIPPARLAELIETPAFTAIRALAFQFSGGSAWGDDFEATAFQRLAETPVGERLHSLFLCGGLSPKGLRMLASAKAFGAIRHLVLGYLTGDASDWKGLVSANWFRGLTDLSLGASDPDVQPVVLRGLGVLPSLHTLELHSLTPEAVSELATGQFPRLARLEASRCKLNSGAFQELLRSDWFARVQVLNLASNELTDRAISNLATHPVAQNLQVLRLNNNRIGKAGLLALAQPAAFPKLRELNVSLRVTKQSKLTEAEVTTFLSSLSLPHLRHLELQGLPVGDSGAKAIAANPAFKGLRELWLGEGITKNGMKVLKDAEHLQQTRIL